MFEAGKIVIAVWDDPNKLSADSHVLKGWKLLREAFGQEYFSGVSVIPCQTFEQAVAIQQMFGTPDEDDEKEQLQPHRNDMLWPGVPLWTDAPPAPAEPTTMTVSHWLSFADAKNFYGVAVVDGDVEVCVANVLRDAAKLGCIVPFFHYSKVAMQKLPPDLIPEHYKNRLLTKVEAKRLLTSVIKTESSNK